MTVLLVFFTLLLFQLQILAQDSCLNCHSEFSGTRLGEPVDLFEQDIHSEVGLSCASCHGGDPTSFELEKAKNPARGFIGAPSFDEIPNLCGSCHSSPEFMKRYNPALRIDQVPEYRTSVHGQLSARGDRQVATCTSCHSIHRIRKVSDPISSVHPLRVADTCGRCHSDPERMEPYGIPHDQVVGYKTSVHGNALYQEHDLSAPTCNDCHGNHGAVPPGVASVSNVCGNCHGIQRELFEVSPHYELFLAMELRGCVTCHGNHEVRAADETLLSGDEAVCLTCHESDRGTETAAQIAARIVELRDRINTAHLILSEAEQAGMEVSRAMYDVHEASEKVIFARNQVHALDTEEIFSTVEEGLKIADNSYNEGVSAFEELRFRRRGLFVSVFVIALVIVALSFWIREVDRRD